MILLNCNLRLQTRNHYILADEICCEDSRVFVVLIVHVLRKHTQKFVLEKRHNDPLKQFTNLFNS